MFETTGLKGRLIAQKTPAIVRGEDAFVVVQLYYAGTDKPYSFYQTALGATGYFPSASGSSVPLAATGTIAQRPEYAGQIRIDLDQSQTAQLSVGEQQKLQVSFQDGYGLTVILMESVLSIADPYY